MTWASGDDERALRSLNERYFNALDRLDFSAIGDCFTTDAKVVYLGGDWELEGRQEVVDRLGALRDFEATIHTVATMSFLVDDDGLSGEVFAIAHISLLQDGDPRVMVRGLRYRDRYRRDPDAWRIVARRQDPLWQFDVAGAPPMIPAQQSHHD